MKILATLACTVLCFTACGRKNAAPSADSPPLESASPNNTSLGTLTCTLDSQPFTAASVLNGFTTKFDIRFSGTDAGKKHRIDLVFPRAKVAVGAQFGYRFVMGESPESQIDIGTPGPEVNGLTETKSRGVTQSTITITKADPNLIEGTFTASGKEVSATDGKFSVALPLVW
jgi:hypothetical protein